LIWRWLAVGWFGLLEPVLSMGRQVKVGCAATGEVWGWLWLVELVELIVDYGTVMWPEWLGFFVNMTGVENSMNTAGWKYSLRLMMGWKLKVVQGQFDGLLGQWGWITTVSWFWLEVGWTGCCWWSSFSTVIWSQLNVLKLALFVAMEVAWKWVAFCIRSWVAWWAVGLTLPNLQSINDRHNLVALTSTISTTAYPQ
jgi:hypothetical protein